MMKKPFLPILALVIFTALAPGSSSRNVNTSLFKRIPLKEQLNLQFRVEAFNVFNHANFSHPELIVFSSGSEIAGSAGVIREVEGLVKGFISRILPSFKCSRRW